MDRPSQVWKDMPVDKRVLAAEAFWLDRESPEIDVQQMEAVATLARRLKFRTRSIQALSVERRARHLAQVNDLGDTVVTRALIAYHFSHQRPLMGAFLDALGIEHDEGLITAEDVAAPDEARLSKAVAAVKTSFDPSDVDLYLRTLAVLDSGTWANIPAVLRS